LGIKTGSALALTGLSKHQFYYKPLKAKKRGVIASTTTKKWKDNKCIEVSNATVIKEMQSNHSDPDLHYGYQRMTGHLKMLGYQINHKKVYRIMKENNMLHQKVKVADKQYVKYRKVEPSGPLEVLEMDIKFQYVENRRQHAFILTVIDTFTRMILGWKLGFSIKQYDVRKLWESIVVEHLQVNNMLEKGIRIEVRNDNDPRFSAKSVQQFFQENYLNQVFTHPYTPEENGHIESFHAILGRALSNHIFFTLGQLEAYLTTFYDKYNNQRIHGSIANLPPRIFWKAWENNWISYKKNKKKKTIFKLKIPHVQLCKNISGNKRLEGSFLL